MPDPIYLIGEGVRRCVAFRELGIHEIAARVLRNDGTRGPEFMVRLDQLYSRKFSIERFDLGGRYLAVESAAATASGRLALTPIEVTELSARRAKHFTPLMDVVLER